MTTPTLRELIEEADAVITALLGYCSDQTSTAKDAIGTLEGIRASLAAQPELPEQPDSYPPLPEPLEIRWPDLHSHALGCGVEDRGLTDRYDCAEYGWQDGVDKAVSCVPEQIFDGEMMRTYVDADRENRKLEPMTDEQIQTIGLHLPATPQMGYLLRFARAIEAHHGIGDKA